MYLQNLDKKIWVHNFIIRLRVLIATGMFANTSTYDIHMYVSKMSDSAVKTRTQKIERSGNQFLLAK